MSNDILRLRCERSREDLTAEGKEGRGENCSSFHTLSLVGVRYEKRCKTLPSLHAFSEETQRISRCGRRSKLHAYFVTRRRDSQSQAATRKSSTPGARGAGLGKEGLRISDR